MRSLETRCRILSDGPNPASDLASAEGLARALKLARLDVKLAGTRKILAVLESALDYREQ